MTDPRQPLSDAALNRALRDLSAEIAFPPTPDLAPAVRARLTTGAAVRPGHWWAGGPPGLPWLTGATGPPRPALWRRPLLVALAAILLVLAGLLLYPPSARLLAERLGVRGIDITWLPSVGLPTPSATASPAGSGLTPAGTPAGASLRLGERLTLDEARARVRFEVLVPSLPELAAPDEIYVGQPPAGGQVALVYHARAGLPRAGPSGVAVLLTEFRGATQPEFFGKGLGPGTRLEPVQVGGPLVGYRGFWLEGAPHVFFYRDTAGQIRDEAIRLAGNTLIWERDDLTFRLEANVSRDEALRIANSLR